MEAESEDKVQVYGCDFRVSPSDGVSVDVVCVEVEIRDEPGDSIGLSLTEKEGIAMRRIAVELSDDDQIEMLRDVLSAHLARKQLRPA